MTLHPERGDNSAESEQIQVNGTPDFSALHQERIRKNAYWKHKV
jgi:hypothetical protein